METDNNVVNAPILFAEGYNDKDEWEKRKMRLLNKHLLSGSTPYEGTSQLPKVLPYSGEIPDVFIPYNAKVCYNSKEKGVYCHIDDACFNTVWTHPVQLRTRREKASQGTPSVRRTFGF